FNIPCQFGLKNTARVKARELPETDLLEMFAHTSHWLLPATADDPPKLAPNVTAPAQFVVHWSSPLRPTETVFAGASYISTQLRLPGPVIHKRTCCTGDEPPLIFMPKNCPCPLPDNPLIVPKVGAVDAVEIVTLQPADCAETIVVSVEHRATTVRVKVPALVQVW